MLADPREVLADAEKRNYAIAGINTPTFDAAVAVLEAAEELDWPVMIGLAEVHDVDASIDMLAPMLHDLAVRSKARVILHLDHGETMEYVMKAIRYGFTSIMYDCSHLPLDENAAKLKEFAEIAHKLNIIVEAEVGLMPSTIVSNSGGGEGGVSAEGDITQFFSDPAEVARFVDLSGVDMMAISFGNVHGDYVGEPKLDIPRLKRTHELTKCHLVMHGTTGVDDAQIRQAIDNGIRKFNYFTGVATAATRPVLNYITTAKNTVYVQEISHTARDAMKKEAMRVIQLFRNGA
ncbi:MAG: class II fructose-bisphosphate aldolase [Planctomycetaceae bacterium]|nr:class II fructose-bisphosphate aldolase [Planctomycetaceae bacterium]